MDDWPIGMSSLDVFELELEPALQAKAEAEIGEPSTLEGKLECLNSFRRLISEIPSEVDRIRDTSARNLVRFLRSSKYNLEKALGRTIDYTRFFAKNRELDNLRPEQEFVVLQDLMQVFRDLPGQNGRVVVCLYPKLALSRITEDIIKSNPRLLLRANVWMFERLSLDKQVQVCGLIVLNSFCDVGVTLQISLSQLVNISERRLAFSFFGIMGFRLGVAMIFQEPTFLTWFWFIIKQFVSAKIRDRFSLNGGDYSRIDAVLGSDLRQHLPEPFHSLNTVPVDASAFASRPSWVLQQIEQQLQEK